MDSTFDFRLIHPDGNLSASIQSVWSASVSSNSESVTKPLFSDGCSGVFLILEGTAIFNDCVYPRGAYWTPVKRQAETIELTTGSQLLGFRFQPATHLSVVLPDFDIFLNKESTGTADNDTIEIPLLELLDILASQPSTDDQLSALVTWLAENIGVNESSNTLAKAIAAIDPTTELQGLEALIPMSLRQIERQFKHQVGMTPKLYQRLIRVKSTIDLIKKNPEINLAELASEGGYSDQAHMTREFRKLAKITPGEYQLSKLLNKA